MDQWLADNKNEILNRFYEKNSAKIQNQGTTLNYCSFYRINDFRRL